LKLRGSAERLRAQAPDFEGHLPGRLRQSRNFVVTKIDRGIVMRESRYGGFSMEDRHPASTRGL
jgi:hypothetical protein